MFDRRMFLAAVLGVAAVPLVPPTKVLPIGSVVLKAADIEWKASGGGYLDVGWQIPVNWSPVPPLPSALRAGVTKERVVERRSAVFLVERNNPDARPLIPDS